MLSIIITLVIVGVILYLINTYVPVDSKIKTILNWAVVIGTVVWLLRVAGLLS